MKTIITMVLSLFVALSITGQNIAAFSGTKTPTTATIPNITAEALSRGPALTVASGTTFNSGNWATGGKLDTNSYIQWSITADPDYIINITELQINFDRDPDGVSHFFAGNGPAKIRIRTSLDNFASDIYSNDKVSNSGLSPNIETLLNSQPGGTITFRLYGFSSTIGLLGPLGTFDIEGGLEETLGLANTGIRLVGKVTYDGLLYSDGRWTPKAPSANTGEENVLVSNGTYTEAKQVQIKNLKVASGAGIIIQKTGAITVDGNLITSNNVILKSDANNYSSLIVKDTVTGTVEYQRQVNITAPVGALGTNILISAPVTGEPFDVFRSSNPNIVSNKAKTMFSFGPFNKTKSTYTTYSNTETAELTPATGYSTATSKNGKFIFKGTVNTKPIHKNILTLGTANSEWNLIGNPYPSYINTSEFLSENKTQFAPESTGIYSFNGDPSNEWTIWNLAYLTLHPNAKIAPGQGFLVASKPAGSIVTFTPNMRSVGNTQGFKIRKDNTAKRIGFLKLKLTNGISNYNTNFYFNDQSTRGLDPGYDAGVYNDKAPSFAIYSHLAEDSSGIDMAVQSLSYADLSSEIVIPLGVNASRGQRITLSIAESILPKEIEVYLEDKETNTFILLNTNDYNFYADSDVLGIGRFFLHLTNATLSFGNNVHNSPKLFTSNMSHIMHIIGDLEPDTLITVFDLSGRLMISTKLDENFKKTTVDLSILKSGMYLVKLKNSSHDKIKKIVIEKEPLKNDPFENEDLENETSQDKQ